jgi:hypothetical protein
MFFTPNIVATVPLVRGTVESQNSPISIPAHSASPQPEGLFFRHSSLNQGVIEMMLRDAEVFDMCYRKKLDAPLA